MSSFWQMYSNPTEISFLISSLSFVAVTARLHNSLLVGQETRTESSIAPMDDASARCLTS